MATGRQRLLHVALGQMLSLSLVASGATSQLLANRGFSLPFLQNALFYFLLFLLHLPRFLKSPPVAHHTAAAAVDNSAKAKCLRVLLLLRMPALAVAGSYT